MTLGKSRYVLLLLPRITFNESQITATHTYTPIFIVKKN